MNLSQLPNLRAAVAAMAAANGVINRQHQPDLDKVHIPTAWVERAIAADGQARAMSGLAINSFIPEDEIDPALATSADDCIDIMTDGEESVKNLLVMYSGAVALDTILDAFFDGELAPLL